MISNSACKRLAFAQPCGTVRASLGALCAASQRRLACFIMRCLVESPPPDWLPGLGHLQSAHKPFPSLVMCGTTCLQSLNLIKYWKGTHLIHADPKASVLFCAQKWHQAWLVMVSCCSNSLPAYISPCSFSLSLLRRSLSLFCKSGEPCQVYSPTYPFLFSFTFFSSNSMTIGSRQKGHQTMTIRSRQ